MKYYIVDDESKKYLVRTEEQYYAYATLRRLLYHEIVTVFPYNIVEDTGLTINEVRDLLHAQGFAEEAITSQLKGNEDFVIELK